MPLKQLIHITISLFMLGMHLSLTKAKASVWSETAIPLAGVHCCHLMILFVTVTSVRYLHKARSISLSLALSPTPTHTHTHTPHTHTTHTTHTPILQQRRRQQSLKFRPDQTCHKALYYVTVPLGLTAP